MKKCSKCKEEIAEDAKKCKHCGADQRNWFIRHKILTGVLGLVVLIVIISVATQGSINTTSTNSGETQNTNNEQTAQPEKKKLSLDEVYAKIQTGMTEDQVNQIVTSEPINCTESEMQGIGTSKLCTYGNVFTEQTTLMVDYTNGKVTSKTKSQY